MVVINRGMLHVCCSWILQVLSFSQLIKKNDQEARNIDVIFSKKQEKESKVEELKVQLESKRMAVEDVIGNMEEDVLGQYQTMTAQSESTKKVRMLLIFVRRY